MTAKIVVLDYGLGNVRSVGNALRLLGAAVDVSRDLATIDAADGLVIPGVGAFPQAMQNLSEAALIEPIRDYMRSGRPVLGICLGMQILFDRGTEFTSTDGLKLIPGVVDRIPIPAGEGRLPHIAWSAVKRPDSGRNVLLGNLAPEELRFYFVHSFAASTVPAQFVTGTATYLGRSIVAAVESGNVYGTQFHPEKSGPSGLKVLGNFISSCQRGEVHG